MPTTKYIRFGGGGNPEMAEMMRMRAEIWVWATDGCFSILQYMPTSIALLSPLLRLRLLPCVMLRTHHPFIQTMYTVCLPCLTLHLTSSRRQRFISNKFLLGLGSWARPYFGHYSSASDRSVSVRARDSLGPSPASGCFVNEWSFWRSIRAASGASLSRLSRVKPRPRPPVVLPLSQLA